MTLFYGNPNQDMNERALRFLGAFSHIQICIDEMLAKTFFEKRIPKAARVVWKRTVGRIRDDERVDLFQAIAADLGSDAELDTFNQVYMETKRLRDKVAHSAGLQSSGMNTLVLTESYVRTSTDEDLNVTTVESEELIDATLRCRWIEAQILYVLHSTDLTEELYWGDRHIAVVKPTRRYKDWGGVVYTDLDNPGRCTM